MDGQVQVRVQPLLIGVVEVLVIVIAPWKAPCQLPETAKCTAHPAPAGGGTVNVTGGEGSDVLPFESTATTS